jgi:hypothetical protein
VGRHINPVSSLGKYVLCGIPSACVPKVLFPTHILTWLIFCHAYNRYLFAEAGAGRHAQSQADDGVQWGDHGEEEPALFQQHFPVVEIRDIFGTDTDPGGPKTYGSYGSGYGFGTRTFTSFFKDKKS